MISRSLLILRVSTRAGLRELFGGATFWSSIIGTIGWIVTFAYFYSGYSRRFGEISASTLRQHFWNFHILFTALMFLGALAAFVHKAGSVTEEHLLRARGVSAFEASLGTITQGIIFFLILLMLLLPASVAFMVRLHAGPAVVGAMILVLSSTVVAASAAAYTLTVLVRSRWAIGPLTKALFLVTVVLGYSLLGVGAHWIDTDTLFMHPWYDEPNLGSLLLVSAMEIAFASTCLMAGVRIAGGDVHATSELSEIGWDWSRLAPVLARLAPASLEPLVLKDLRQTLRASGNFALFLINWAFTILPGALFLRNSPQGPFRAILADILLIGTTYQVCVFIGANSVLSDRGMLWLLRASDPKLTRWLGGKIYSVLIVVAATTATVFIPIGIIGMIPFGDILSLGLVCVLTGTLLTTGLSCLPLIGWPVPVVVTLGLCTAAAIFSNATLNVLKSLGPPVPATLSLVLGMIWVGVGLAIAALGRHLLVSRDLGR